MIWIIANFNLEINQINHFGTKKSKENLIIPRRKFTIHFFEIIYNKKKI
jgi:hypothetical protein